MIEASAGGSNPGSTDSNNKSIRMRLAMMSPFRQIMLAITFEFSLQIKTLRTHERAGNIQPLADTSPRKKKHSAAPVYSVVDHSTAGKFEVSVKFI